MDTAAKLAIEAMLIGMAEAKVIGFEQLASILRTIEDIGASAGVNMPGVESDLDVMVANIRHQTGCYEGSAPRS